IGMGILKMKETMVAAGLREPTFEPDGFFRAIFHRSSEFAMKESTPGTEAIGNKPRDKIAEKTAQKTIQKTAQKIINLNSEKTRDYPSGSGD
ncbi:MAG: hypothetical protein HY801_03995, partial [Candidatus Lindowbacteria bacterium]|nr:hypothetical protein [Candidatus Lindowbacteria bacterium]